MKGGGRTVLAIALAAAIVVALAPYWSAASLISRAAATSGWLGVVSQWAARHVSPSIAQIPTRWGPIRGRVFRPDGAATRAALPVSGVHRARIDQPRLVGLARDLAATGIVVVTPEIDDLTHSRLTARVTDTIEDAAVWIAARRIVRHSPHRLIA